MTLAEKINQLSTELQNFLAEMNEQPQLAIHEIRKRTKFIRALLKLSPNSPKELKLRLKIVSGLIAPYRDAKVTLDTYRIIVAETPLEMDAELESLLLQNPYILNQHPGKSIITEINQQMLAFSKLFKKSMLDLQQELVQNRISKTYRSGKIAFKRVQGNSSAEIVHSWRKKTKRLWYQLRFRFGDVVDELDHPLTLSDRLGKCLGEIHDLDVLSTLLANDQHPNLYETIRGKRQQLLQASFRLGESLYTHDSIMIFQTIHQQK